MQEEKIIKKIIEKELKQEVVKMQRMTTGICNEVFSVRLPKRDIIVRLNKDKANMIGSEKHIPLLASKGVPVPKILASDYSKKEFPYAYQILSKLPGKDIGLIIHKLSDKELKGIAKEISTTIKKLSKISTNGKFGWVGNNVPLYRTWLEIQQPTKVIARNKKTGVVGQHNINLVKKVVEKYKDYFKNVESTFYYDDLSSKNVIINNGKFVGLVDLDTMAYGDPLEAVGRIKASWYGTKYGDTYTKAIEKCLKLNRKQKEMVTVYALLNRIHWLSEKGIQFNKNTSKNINQVAVKKDKKVINQLAAKLGF